MDQLNSGIAVHSTDKLLWGTATSKCKYPGLRELAPLSALGHTNIQIQIKMDPSWTELAPLSALGHSNIKMEVSGSARTSPFICFGAHQYPNSNMSNVLTQYLTLVGTLLHNTFSDSTARRRMGSEKQKGGGVGQQAVGQTQHPSRNCGISAKGGRGKKKKFGDFFLRSPFLQRAQSQKLIFFCVFFCAKQHLGPRINYFRK